MKNKKRNTIIAVVVFATLLALIPSKSSYAFKQESKNEYELVQIDYAGCGMHVKRAIYGIDPADIGLWP